ncbi:hypothetical protein OUZ56_017668 [Daphnia magna]|uniref:Uncharacterized protein n=1 Tax=Daphnia magna TaxID=35525 RepID=A0ABR0ATE4_9CRUS|nr:hypothetical protein OUZ56_017668 [Daphnia magna]
MQREPEENMRRYANRICKAFHLAYPIKSSKDKATAFSREQIMMDRFLEGLSFDVQTRLKYKEFETFEKLIEKAEMMAMAVEEAQVRSRLNAFQPKYVEPNRELTKVKEALDRLSTQVESNTHEKRFEENMEKMQRKLSTRRNTSFSQRSPILPPDIGKLSSRRNPKKEIVFIVDDNLYEWNHLAFGLTNAPRNLFPILDT